jgi:hypothetical protein
MVLKIKKASVEKLGKQTIDIEDLGYPRFQKFVKDRLIVCTENSYVLHFDKNMNLIFQQNRIWTGYHIMFNENYDIWTYNAFYKFDKETNSYISVNLPQSVYSGSEALGNNYYWRMSSAVPTILEVYDLNGNKIKEIDLSEIPNIQPFTNAISNKDGTEYYGYSVYNPNIIVKVNIDGTYEVKDISSLGASWIEFISYIEDKKEFLLIINGIKIGLYNFETNTLEALHENNIPSFYYLKENVGISHNKRYVIFSIDIDKVKIVDLETKNYWIKDTSIEPDYVPAVYPIITDNGKGYIVFFDLAYYLYYEIRRFGDSRIVDTGIIYYDYPFSIDIVEFEV